MAIFRRHKCISLHSSCWMKCILLYLLFLLTFHKKLVHFSFEAVLFPTNRIFGKIIVCYFQMFPTLWVDMVIKVIIFIWIATFYKLKILWSGFRISRFQLRLVTLIYIQQSMQCKNCISRILHPFVCTSLHKNSQ